MHVAMMIVCTVCWRGMCSGCMRMAVRCDASAEERNACMRCPLLVCRDTTYSNRHAALAIGIAELGGQGGGGMRAHQADVGKPMRPRESLPRLAPYGSRWYGLPCAPPGRKPRTEDPAGEARERRAGGGRQNRVPGEWAERTSHMHRRSRAEGCGRHSPREGEATALPITYVSCSRRWDYARRAHDLPPTYASPHFPQPGHTPGRPSDWY